MNERSVLFKTRIFYFCVTSHALIMIGALINVNVKRFSSLLAWRPIFSISVHRRCPGHGGCRRQAPPAAFLQAPACLRRPDIRCPHLRPQADLRCPHLQARAQVRPGPVLRPLQLQADRYPGAGGCSPRRWHLQLQVLHRERHLQVRYWFSEQDFTIDFTCTFYDC